MWDLFSIRLFLVPRTTKWERNFEEHWITSNDVPSILQLFLPSVKDVGADGIDGDANGVGVQAIGNIARIGPQHDPIPQFLLNRSLLCPALLIIHQRLFPA
jgi:hypothetical protein